MTRLTLTKDLEDKLTSALGGKRPTARRLMELLAKGAPMDKSDIEQGRTPYSPRVHAETIGGDVGEMVSHVEDARQRRQADGKERIASRIEEHRARGLDPSAPPEDPAAAVLAEDDSMAGAASPPSITPTVIHQDETSFVVDMGPGPGNETAEIERLKAAGMAKTREVADTLERRVLQRMPQIAQAGGKLRSLEEAAEILIGELQPNHVDAIRQVCLEHTLEPWVVILGALARMADLQELHTGEYDPSWTNRAPGGTRPASIKEQRCEVCQGVLPTDARRGQRYCCSFHGSNRLDHSPPEMGGCSLSHLQMVGGKWVDTQARART